MGRREDDSSEDISSRGVKSPGLDITSTTAQSARPLIPTIPAMSTPTRAGRENILAPLNLTPVEHEAREVATSNETNASGSGASSSAVMEQLKQFFTTPGEFNKKNLEQRLEELNGQDNRTKQERRPSKDLSVSGYQTPLYPHSLYGDGVLIMAGMAGIEPY